MSEQIQYIGARYVVKIYQNKTNPSTAEWDVDVNYEPLTLVTFNNGSYLSKRDVPATIGNPAENPLYWVQTGFYNGQISELQREIDTLNSLIENEAAVRVQNDNALRTTINENTTAITNEAAARSGADTELRTLINSVSDSLASEISSRASADSTLQGNIDTVNANLSSETTARQAADTNLQNQITQIIAPSGEAPSAAEVTDARIGFDGTVYNTLGLAIRTQVSNLNQPLSGIVSMNEFIFEYGYVGVTDNALAYEYFAGKRVRTRMNRPLYLRSGDIIKFKSPIVRVYVIYSSDGSSWSNSIGWQTSDYTIVNNGYYMLMLSDGVESAKVDLDAFIHAINIVSAYDSCVIKSLIDNDIQFADSLNNGVAIWEKGNVRQAEGSLIYETNATRLRLKKDFVVKLKAGDKINFTSPIVRVYILYSADNSTWSTIGWINSTDYSVANDGYYTFMLSDGVETTPPSIDIFSSHVDIETQGQTVLNQYLGFMANQIDTINLTLPKLVKRFDYDASVASFAANIKNGIDGNCLVFVHVTDSHVGTSILMELARGNEHAEKVFDIANAVNADFIIHTGDMIQGDGSLIENSKLCYEAYTYNLSKLNCPFLFCQGNPWHDFGQYAQNGDYPYELTRSQVLTMAARHKKWVGSDYNNNDISSYYYFDDALRKVRCIVLDSDDWGITRLNGGFSSEQITWFTSVLADARSHNLPVIVFSHMAPIDSIGQGDLDTRGGSDIHGALVNHIASGGSVIEFIYGHIHADLQTEINGVNYTALTCDIPQQRTVDLPSGAVAPVRELGTITEFAFDVHVINCDTHTDYIYRYGAGNNRTVI